MDANMNRNLWTLFLFMVFFCDIHVLSWECILAKRWRGNILFFPRGRRPAIEKRRDSDEETPHIPNETVSESKVEGATRSKLPARLEANCSTFHWTDLCYDIEVKGKQKRRLTELDGWISQEH